MASERAVVTLECPCCGDDAWSGFENDEILDGSPLACGCKGWISCDSETEPWVNAYDCDCQDREVANGGE